MPFCSTSRSCLPACANSSTRWQPRGASLESPRAGFARPKGLARAKPADEDASLGLVGSQELQRLAQMREADAVVAVRAVGLAGTLFLDRLLAIAGLACFQRRPHLGFQIAASRGVRLRGAGRADRHRETQRGPCRTLDDTHCCSSVLQTGGTRRRLRDRKWVTSGKTGNAAMHRAPARTHDGKNLK